SEGDCRQPKNRLVLIDCQLMAPAAQLGCPTTSRLTAVVDLCASGGLGAAPGEDRLIGGGMRSRVWRGLHRRRTHARCGSSSSMSLWGAGRPASLCGGASWSTY